SARRGFRPMRRRSITERTHLGGTLRHAESLIEYLPDPIVVVTRGGDLVDGNRAFRDLAERSGVMALPAEVFGAAFIRALTRAWIERHIEPELQVMVGPEPRS